MQVYSKTIAAFVSKWEQEAKKIIRNELSLMMRTSRFEYNNYLYPLHIIVVEHKQYLGYFDSKTFHIALNEKLVYASKDSIIRDILRHELAHYLCHVKYKNDNSAHGENFNQVCSDAGWDKRVSAASLDIHTEGEIRVGELANEKIIERVKKLLSLASSDNSHEAEVATLKANSLLLKYNLQNIEQSDDTKYFSCAIMTAKRKNAAMDAIYSILKHFMVKPILRYAKGEVRLEVTGTRENIELAQYICDFLQRTLEELWKQAIDLKGQRAKNSFYLGIAEGYQQKMDAANKSLFSEYRKELVILNKALDNAYSGIYKSVRGSSSQGQIDNKSFNQGTKKGRDLSIKHGIKNKSKTFLLT